MEIQGVENWIGAQNSQSTRYSYRLGIQKFHKFCMENQISGLETIVQDFRAARDSDNRQKLHQYTDKWDDVVQSYNIYLKDNHALAAVATYLATIRSFFKKNRLPIQVDIPKRIYTTYPKADLERKTIRRIMRESSVRNRAIWLMLCESGIRPYTVTQIRWSWIKQDYLAERVPMMIRIPQRYTKDYVGDRWSFIGSDGYDALREYLEPRLPLGDDDYVFVREPPKPREKRQKKWIPGTLWRSREEDPMPIQPKPFTSSNLSSMFSYIVKALKLDSGLYGKPGKIRLYCLKNWFRNHCKADYGFTQFWMLRSNRTDSHYISRDPEEHRERYRKAYPELRIMEDPIAIANAQKEIQQQLQNRDQEIQGLKKEIDEIKEYRAEFQNMIRWNAALEMLFDKIPEKAWDKLKFSKEEHQSVLEGVASRLAIKKNLEEPEKAA